MFVIRKKTTWSLTSELNLDLFISGFEGTTSQSFFIDFAQFSKR